MAEPHVMDALRLKGPEVRGTVSHREQQIVHHRANLVHLDAAMRLFDPDLAPEEAGIRPQRPRSAWFHPGECLRLIHDVLREAPQPMTTRALTEQVMGMKATQQPMNAAARWSKRLFSGRSAVRRPPSIGSRP